MAQDCGTYAGWNAHVKAKEPVCDACRKAKTMYMREYRANRDGAAEIDRRRQAARDRALSRLAARHPGEYRDLYEAESDADQRIAELKKQMEATRPSRRASW